LALSFEKGSEKGARVLAEAATYPENFFFNPDEWACSQVAARYGVGRICDLVDVAAAKKIEPLVKRGDVILDNFYSASVGATLNAKAVLSAFSRAYVTGMGIKFSKDNNFSMGVGYFKQTGFRAMTFWNTLDIGVLQELNANFLYVDPDNLPPELYAKLRNEPQLELIHREIDANSAQVREVYRANAKSSVTTSFVPADFSFRSMEMPSTLQPERFYRIPIVFITRDPSFKGEAKIFYRILYLGRLVNLGDEIKQTLTLKKNGHDEYAGSLYFGAPYEEGDYELDFYVLDANGYRSLLDENRNKVVLRIHVT